jgi:hypothetical protein
MLTHISSQIRGIFVRAVSLMSVLLHNNIQLRMLGYQVENEVWNSTKFCLKLVSNSFWKRVWNILSNQKFDNEIWNMKK